MSGGERKKRLLPQGVKGWEEAGGEFYQESYPGAESDLEMMQTDPHRISTLLPSKKTRTGKILPFWPFFLKYYYISVTFSNDAQRSETEYIKTPNHLETSVSGNYCSSK